MIKRGQKAIIVLCVKVLHGSDSDEVSKSSTNSKKGICYAQLRTIVTNNDSVSLTRYVVLVFLKFHFRSKHLFNNVINDPLNECLRTLFLGGGWNLFQCSISSLLLTSDVICQQFLLVFLQNKSDVQYSLPQVITFSCLGHCDAVLTGSWFDPCFSSMCYPGYSHGDSFKKGISDQPFSFP